ncbi:hypothetical protein AO376_0081 [Moraxella catarrhalis]|nr:hypothetical protein AO374_1914 [Moraxella catarrhalis]OAV16083.1 hypothetical protein AO376_0081 [Moraxella catarrhalis]
MPFLRLLLSIALYNHLDMLILCQLKIAMATIVSNFMP